MILCGKTGKWIPDEGACIHLRVGEDFVGGSEHGEKINLIGLNFFENKG